MQSLTPSQASAAQEPQCLACRVPLGPPAFSAMDNRLGTVARPFALRRCAACGYGRLDPMPTDEEIAASYPPGYYVPNGPLATGAYRPVTVANARRLVRDVAMRASGNRLLEVGMGAGHMLLLFHEAGFRVTGIDTNPDAGAAIPKDAGLDVRVARLQDAGLPDDEFDVVFMKQVLEHIPDAASVVREILRVLKPGGVAYFEVPNTGGWEARAFGPHWWNLEVPRHIHHFTMPAMRAFLTDVGFSDVEFARNKGVLLLKTPLANVHSLRFALDDRVGPRAARGVALLAAPLVIPLTLAGRALAPRDRDLDLRAFARK